MLHIIHVNASYKPAWLYGGPTYSVSQLCENLALKTSDGNFSLEVLTTSANGAEELKVPLKTPQYIDGVQVTYYKRITKDHSHFSPSLLLALRQKIHQHGADQVIVHIHAWWNLVSILTALTALAMHAKYVISPRGMLTNYTLEVNHSIAKKIFHRVIGRYLLRKATIHATSELESVIASQILNTKSRHIIYNLVDFPEKDRKTDKNFENFNLLYLSRIDEKKGIELLFKALSNCVFEWKLEIAGSGSEDYIRSLKTLSRQLNIDAHVAWLGHLDKNQKFLKINEASLLCLTSYNENFANVIVESLSQGTAVLVSDKVGLAEFVKAHDLGWVCGLSVQEITDNLTAAFNGQLKLKRIEQTGSELVAAYFNKNILGNKYLELYAQIRKNNDASNI